MGSDLIRCPNANEGGGSRGGATVSRGGQNNRVRVRRSEVLKILLFMLLL